VVCGAWHAPALEQPWPSATSDAQLLRHLPTCSTRVSWIPWTHSRLSAASGYGAGVDHPGWYAHLFTTTDRPVVRWLTQLATQLRMEGIPTSSAHIIESVRLAQALAALRGQHLPGYIEVSQAARSVISQGQDAMLETVMAQQAAGEQLGRIPAHAPTVSLEADLAAWCKRLRLPRQAHEVTKALDLRQPTDLQRSTLLHRLCLLGVGWGTHEADQVRHTGTFRETWSLQWHPEMAVQVVEAALWGNTVEQAATAKVCVQALTSTLPELAVLLEQALLAQLGTALPDLLAALDSRSAQEHDLATLMQALPPLVRTFRYGDVRGTDTSTVAQVVQALMARVCAGLPAAVTGLDEQAAGQRLEQMQQVHEAVALFADPYAQQEWLLVVASVAGRADVPAVLAGRITRWLRDAGVWDAQACQQRLARALSVGATPANKASWVEGFLAGSGLLLVHDPSLLTLLDTWVVSLDDEQFGEVVPLLRRTFGAMAPAERRSIGQAAAQLGVSSPPPSPASAGVGSAVAAPPARAQTAVRAASRLLRGPLGAPPPGQEADHAAG
jgi:hypothetical protein